jgi:hypothetical protein
MKYKFKITIPVQMPWTAEIFINEKQLLSMNGLENGETEVKDR